MSKRVCLDRIPRPVCWSSSPVESLDWTFRWSSSLIEFTWLTTAGDNSRTLFRAAAPWRTFHWHEGYGRRMSSHSMKRNNFWLRFHTLRPFLRTPSALRPHSLRAATPKRHRSTRKLSNRQLRDRCDLLRYADHFCYDFRRDRLCSQQLHSEKVWLFSLLSEAIK